jgi:hypothetical protein
MMGRIAVLATALLFAVLPAFARDTKPAAEVIQTPTGPAIALTWTNPTIPSNVTCPSGSGSTALTSNKVYRATAPGSEGTAAYATISPAATTYTDTGGTPGLTPGTTYYYKVSAVNCGGESTQSLESNPALILNPQVPGAPTGLTATVTQAVAVLLQWNPVTTDNKGKPLIGSVYYDLYRCETSLNPCSKPTQLLQNASPLVCSGYLDTHVTTKAKYAYWVQATNITFGGAWSAQATVKVP